MTLGVATIDALARDLARLPGADPTLIGMLTAPSVTNAGAAQAPNTGATGTGHSALLPDGAEAVSTHPRPAGASATAAIERGRPLPTWSK